MAKKRFINIIFFSGGWSKGWESGVAAMSFELFIKSCFATACSSCQLPSSSSANPIMFSVYLALDEQVLSMAPDEGFWEEGSKVDHDLSQKRTDGPKSHLVSKICKCKLKSIGPFDSVKISSGTLTPLGYSNVFNDIHLQLLCEHGLSTRSWYGQRSLVDKGFDVKLIRSRFWRTRTHPLEIARGLKDSYITLDRIIVDKLGCWNTFISPEPGPLECPVLGDGVEVLDELGPVGDLHLVHRDPHLVHDDLQHGLRQHPPQHCGGFPHWGWARRFHSAC